MKKTLFTALLAGTVLVSNAQEGTDTPTQLPVEPVEKELPYEKTIDNMAYMIGVQIAMQMERSGIEGLNVDVLRQGFQDTKKGEGKIALEDFQKIAMTFEQELREKAQEVAKIENAKGKIFLDELSKKEGVKTTASGLRYEVIKAGEGEAKPQLTDLITAHYKGTTMDGEVFDSSEGKPPLTMPLAQLIPGWKEAFQLMNKGAKWKLYIPSSLAYGDMGAPPKIKPGATLIFEVELLDFKAVPQQPQGLPPGIQLQSEPQ
ncbi:MAG: FKBP-type peptidyl-prolyl cis-trans isomerase [Lentisphaeria bacterium]|nr:FKBP-type peptidyl-prolyl cis-trans isomerase [Lentisphaeria bacterium]